MAVPDHEVPDHEVPDHEVLDHEVLDHEAFCARGELLLFVYGRVPAADRRLAVFGDPSLARAWQRATAL